MTFSEDQLRETYRRYKDSDLIRIAEMDADSLTPSALLVLKEEIQRRDLQYKNPSKPAFKILDQNTLDAFSNCIQNAFCPICNDRGNLNRIRMITVAGVGHFYVKKIKYFIICRKCTRKKVFENAIYGLLPGISTVFPWFLAINNNFYNLGWWKSGKPSLYLIDFVRAKYKIIDPIKENVFAVSELIKATNG
jgi:hypothetical protein